MVMVGTLIAESLAVGAVLDAVALTTPKISRADLGDVQAGQPETWTFIEFEVRDEDANRLADSLERSLRRTAGWLLRLPQRRRNVRRVRGANIPIPPGRSVKQSRRSRVRTIRRSTRGSAGLAVLAPRSTAMRVQVSAGSGIRCAPRATYSAFRDIRIVGRLEITGARDGVEIDRAWRAVRSGLQATSIWAATDGISRRVGGTSDTSAAVMRELTNCAAKRAVGRGH
jgi:hypothetical protein